ncbi:ClpXP protease specificity-enhancing factor SspB [Azospirillum brasilense]|uniref:ClpXP protease specificity-enhancing factor SspB n=1 Tax=Azospirillum brasilense TaxID=192 RepID=UPI0016460F0B|nr:ClpXP protease specificity-enhancing factor SspB [Azospirillum brasilense]
METQHPGFGYDQRVEKALKSIVADVLKHVAKSGLPGNALFYITFTADHPGVVISERTRTMSAPQGGEITIVIQYNFWNLHVSDFGFSVALIFHGEEETITVPFSAVTTFADPSAKFALQFKRDPELVANAVPPVGSRTALEGAALNAAEECMRSPRGRAANDALKWLASKLKRKA